MNLVLKKKLYIFQCRPLINRKKNIKLDEHIKNIQKKIQKINHNPVLFGKKTLLSNMADWNPAEMIGAHPSHLQFHYMVSL